MRFLMTLAFMLVYFISMSQESFEGHIKYSTHISTTSLAEAGLRKSFENRYGDSLLVYHYKNGNLVRKHLNSDQNGTKFQSYNAETGFLYFERTDKLLLDSLDVKEKSVELIKRKKDQKELIMDKECECYTYNGTSIYNQDITLTYCYSKDTPKVDYELYTNHKDFFLNDFFKKSKRPFLKFSIQTDVFSITYIATELVQENVSPTYFKF